MANPSNHPWSLLNIGRIFYGIAVVQTGLQTIYYNDFPYWFIPPKHTWVQNLVVFTYIFGAALVLAGACIVFKKRVRLVSLLLGGVMMTIFVFYHVPYKLFISENYMQFIAWDTPLKELAIASGAFVIAACFPEGNEKGILGLLGKLTPFGIIFFSIPILSFGMLHFLYAKGVSGYMPTWINNPIFWIYLGGVGLFGSGISFILRIMTSLVATLLGAMIFTWFVILHIPKIIEAPAAYLPGELTSAFLALAYCGIAWVIAGTANKNS